MRALRARSAAVAERRAHGRTGAVEVTARAEARALVSAILRSEVGPRAHHLARAIELRTLIPSGAEAALVELLPTRCRGHRRRHFISATAEVLATATLRRKPVVIHHHPAMMPAHSIRPRTLLKIARTAALLHLWRAHVHSRSSALLAESWTLLTATRTRLRSTATSVLHCRWRRTFAARITIRARLLRWWTVLAARAGLALLIRAAHLSAIAAKAVFARSVIAVLWAGFVVA